MIAQAISGTILLAVIVWSVWQIGWRGGKPEKGDSGNAGPMSGMLP